MAFASRAWALGRSAASLASNFWTLAWIWGSWEHTVVDDEIAGPLVAVPPVDVAAPATPASPRVSAPATAVPAMIVRNMVSSLDLRALLAHLPPLDGTAHSEAQI